MNKNKVKRVLFGRRGNDGLIFKMFMYILLIGISFIYLYPLLRMLATSLMNLEDLIDSTKVWVPSTFQFSNFTKAMKTLNFWDSLFDSLKVSIYPTIIALVSSALIGYGFATYDFPFKKLLMIILIASFLVPTIVTFRPNFVKFNEIQIKTGIKIIGTLKTYLFPAALGYGLRQTLFILIFYQFFKVIPKELIEAAEVDGASQLKIFIRIAIPMSLPAFLICGLYSFVWYWNETSLATLYFGGNYTTLSMAVASFRSLYNQLFPGGATVGNGAALESFNEGILFAGTLLSILPLLVIYFVCQRWFIEGVDKSGIAGN